jgi:hypothetical protein
MELMGRYMAEIGLTPASRSRIAIASSADQHAPVDKFEFVIVYEDANGNRKERPLNDPTPVDALEHPSQSQGSARRHEIDGNL